MPLLQAQQQRFQGIQQVIELGEVTWKSETQRKQPNERANPEGRKRGATGGVGSRMGDQEWFMGRRRDGARRLLRRGRRGEYGMRSAALASWGKVSSNSRARHQGKAERCCRCTFCVCRFACGPARSLPRARRGQAVPVCRPSSTRLSSCCRSRSVYLYCAGSAGGADGPLAAACMCDERRCRRERPCCSAIYCKPQGGEELGTSFLLPHRLYLVRPTDETTAKVLRRTAKRKHRRRRCHCHRQSCCARDWESCSSELYIVAVCGKK